MWVHLGKIIHLFKYNPEDPAPPRGGRVNRAVARGNIMKRKLLLVLAILAVSCWAGVVSADTLSFYNITNTTTDTGGAYSVEVDAYTLLASARLLYFKNNGASGYVDYRNVF